MAYWIDLAEDDNAFVWLTIRDKVIQLRTDRDESTFLLGPILAVDVALIITIIVRVYVAGITFDNLNILATYDAMIFTLFLVAFIPLGIQINQAVTDNHLAVVRKRREQLLRQYSLLETDFHMEALGEVDEDIVEDLSVRRKSIDKNLLMLHPVQQNPLHIYQTPGLRTEELNKKRIKLETLKSKMFLLESLMNELKDRGDSEDIKIFGLKLNPDLQNTLITGLVSVLVTGLSKILANYGIPMPFS